MFRVNFHLSMLSCKWYFQCFHQHFRSSSIIFFLVSQTKRRLHFPLSPQALLPFRNCRLYILHLNWITRFLLLCDGIRSNVSFFFLFKYTFITFGIIALCSTRIWTLPEFGHSLIQKCAEHSIDTIILKLSKKFINLMLLF